MLEYTYLEMHEKIYCGGVVINKKRLIVFFIIKKGEVDS